MIHAACRTLQLTGTGDGAVSTHLKDRLQAIDDAATADVFRQPTTGGMAGRRLRETGSARCRERSDGRKYLRWFFKSRS
jgi:hypothetical protein